jgi:hypothetical protein
MENKVVACESLVASREGQEMAAPLSDARAEDQRIEAVITARRASPRVFDALARQSRLPVSMVQRICRAFGLKPLNLSLP